MCINEKISRKDVKRFARLLKEEQALNEEQQDEPIKDCKQNLWKLSMANGLSQFKETERIQSYV